MDLDIRGNTALVTASTSGLGKAAAKSLAREDANVVINGRNENRLAAAATELDTVGAGRIVPYQGDLTVKEDIEGLVDRTIDEFGQIDHLVTNDGGPPSGSFLETSDEDWYESYDMMVMSIVRLIRKAADHLRADDGGTIVTITSRTVKEAIPSFVLSNSVRMSIIGIEKTLSKELAPEVRANAVLPGPHETARLRTAIQEEVEEGEYDSYQAGLADRGAGNPLNRVGHPDELGRTVAFLSSPQTEFINGVAIPIDGGAGSSNL